MKIYRMLRILVFFVGLLGIMFSATCQAANLQDVVISDLGNGSSSPRRCCSPSNVEVCDDKLLDCIATKSCCKYSPAVLLGISLVVDIVSSSIDIYNNKGKDTTASRISDFAACSTLLMRACDNYASGASIYHDIGASIKVSGKKVRGYISSFNREGIITTLAFADLIAVMIGCSFPTINKEADIAALTFTGINLLVFSAAKISKYCCT